MKILLLASGKTVDKGLAAMIAAYADRISHYCSFDMSELPALKNTKAMNEAEQKEREGRQLLSAMETSDHVVLLDEKGIQPTSEEFAGQISAYMQRGIKRLVFVIGGPYGFDTKVYARAQAKMSLSRMTFSHQMVRLIFTEQLYRAFTIIKGEPYHHS